MKWLVAVLAVCALVSSAHCASDSVAWCYHLPQCSYTTWPTIATQFCNGTRQSPIDIVTSDVKENSNLSAFNFVNFDSTTAMSKIENTGKTIKVILNSGLTVSGGDLPQTFESLQFHLHWGNGTSIPGSEHTVNGKRYPMEMHIVNIGASFNGNTTLAVADPKGLAALGFFIEVGNSPGQPESWRNLSSYLSSIRNQGEEVSIIPGFSINDLLFGVNLDSYYRYLGSLTTPNCNEAVVWTVFKDPIKVSSEIINLFSELPRIGNNESQVMLNVFRGIQPAQEVTTQARETTSSSSKACYSLVLMALGLTLGRH
ncbi:carbonic anhydrase XVb [Labrus bergylta]|uniref:Carbonic anhydrase n=1 Tax=Labrus bergylta TaxID=56723 RepID=A0A3Q3GH59_9LABR|nr:carbonic anhydrase 4-like [Labrus bergylta]XP_020496094.1 carbonic anhydrase 4-like [Labrus bergylta]